MVKLSIVAFVLALVSGCSSIVSDSKYPVSIASNPPKANFVLQNKAGNVIHSGTTPETVTLDASSGFFKGETYTLIFRKDGFEDKSFELDSSVDGWYFGNILFGGLIGMLIVDPATGAMFKLPENAAVQLEERLADKKSEDSSIKVAVIDDLTTEEREKLVQVN